MRHIPALAYLGLCLVTLMSEQAIAQTQVPATVDLKPTFQFDSQAYPLSTIRTQCIDFETIKRGTGPEDYSDCAVTESGEFGTVDRLTYIYAIYCLIPSRSANEGKCGDPSFPASYHRARGLALFVGDSAGGDARLLTQRVDPDIGLHYYEKPDIVHAAAGTILYIPVVIDGTGHFNGSYYYVWENSEWRHLDAMSWLSELRMRIPPGLEIWKGVWPDLRTMDASTGLYRSGDANCFPTGGFARVKLAIRSRQFAVESVAIEPAESR